MFENYVEEHYKPEERITTFPVYENETIFQTKHGPLKIPTKMCKTIRGKDYCMIHSKDVCYKKWCDHLFPKIVTSC
jgi:hypothetical protein